MTNPLAGKKVAILGLGKMGGILLQAFLEKKVLDAEQVRASVKHAARAEEQHKRFGVFVTDDNLEASRQADIVLLSVKPQQVEDVCREIAPAMDAGKLVISLAASVPTQRIESVLGAVPVLRAMPNTPCVIGSGMTAICAGSRASKSHLSTAEFLFDVVGRSLSIDEKQMDAVTGLSASGPAFIYIIIESLAEAGVKVGLPRSIATLLAAQTTLGAADMVLQTGDHPALLKDAVTTPAGCTIDGILELEEGGLRVTLIKAVVKAAQRARELA